MKRGCEHLRRIGLIGALLAGLVGFTGSALAADLYVDDDGLCGGMSPCYTDLPTAIAAALDGDVIHVSEGVYSVGATIDINVPNLTILGPQADVDPRPASGSARIPGSAAEAVFDGGGAIARILDIEEAGIEINGIEVTGGTGDMVYQPSAYPYTTIRYCIVHDALGDEGVQLRSVNSGLMEYNYVFNTVGDGLNFASSVSCIIRYNEVRNIDTTHGGIYTYESDDIEIYGNLVEDLLYGAGITSYYNGDMHIHDNEVRNAVVAGYWSESDFNAGAGGPGTITLEHNLFDSCGEGIFLDQPYVGGAYVVNENNIVGCTYGAEFYLRPGAPYLVDMEDNWWGDASGPADPDGSQEVPPCYDVDPGLQSNLDGLGCGVVGHNPGEDANLDYCPWLTSPYSAATPTPVVTATPAPTLTPTPVPDVPAAGPVGLLLLAGLISLGLLRRRR